MSFCKERPATLPPLDAIGLEPVDHTHAKPRGGLGHRPSGAVAPSRQAPIGLGFTPPALVKPDDNNLFSMGRFATMDGEAIQVDENSPELVEHKVKDLLNKLTTEKFNSISDQIIACANKSEKEKGGRTLIQVVRLVFEKATDESTSELCARLCRKMMEQISTNVQDDGIRNQEGKPITGGQLFRKYLLNRCQEDFERGWVAKEATAAAAATKALEEIGRAHV